MDAFPPLLERARAERFSEADLAPFITAHAELVDEGTRLIPRCFGASQRRTRDVVVLCVLLKQFVSMLDAAVELFGKGCMQPSKLQLRAAFEASIYIDWILQNKREWRARAYQVWNLRRALKWARRVRVGTPEFVEVQEAFAEVFEVTGAIPEEDQDYVQSEIDRLEVRLGSARLKPLNRRFDLLRGHRLYDKAWYCVLLPKRARHAPSFGRICRLVGRRDEHHLIYEVTSESAHASGSDVHIQPGEGGRLLLLPLRDPVPFPDISKQFATLTLHTYIAVLKEYRLGEVGDFYKNWRTRWRPILGTGLRIEPQKQVHDID